MAPWGLAPSQLMEATMSAYHAWGIFSSLLIIIGFVTIGRSLQIFCQHLYRHHRKIILKDKISQCTCQLWCYDGNKCLSCPPWVGFSEAHEIWGIYFQPHLPTGVHVQLTDNANVRYDTFADDRTIGELYVATNNAHQLAFTNILYVDIIATATQTPLMQYIWRRTILQRQPDQAALLTLKKRQSMTFESF